MENQLNLNQTKVESSKVLEIVKNYKDSSNKDLALALEFVQKDFEYTKDTIIKMSKHLDKLETTYNLLHKEYISRNAI
jgi:hypothetical protein